MLKGAAFSDGLAGVQYEKNTRYDACRVDTAVGNLYKLPAAGKENRRIDVYDDGRSDRCAHESDDGF